MDDRDWERMGIDPKKQHRRLAQLWNPWEDCPSGSALEYTDGEVLCLMAVQELGIIAFHKTGGISLKGFK